LLRMRLEAVGIDAVVLDDLSAQVMPHLSLAIGGVRVLVPEDQFDEACQWLAQESKTLREEETDLVCPRCGSRQVVFLHEHRSRVWSFLILFLFMLPVPFIRHRYKCDACAYLWK